MKSAPCPRAASKASLRCSRLEGRYALRRVPLVRFARSDPAKPLTRCAPRLPLRCRPRGEPRRIVSSADLCFGRKPAYTATDGLVWVCRVGLVLCRGALRGTMAHVAPVGGVTALKLPGVSRPLQRALPSEQRDRLAKVPGRMGSLHDGEILDPHARPK